MLLKKFFWIDAALTGIEDIFFYIFVCSTTRLFSRKSFLTKNVMWYQIYTCFDISSIKLSLVKNSFTSSFLNFRCFFPAWDLLLQAVLSHFATQKQGCLKIVLFYKLWLFSAADKSVSVISSYAPNSSFFFRTLRDTRPLLWSHN